MKKLIFVVSLSLVLLVFSGVSFAADTLYRILHADENDSFKAEQDSFIVGQLIGRNNNFFTVKVLKVISGKVDSNNILVPDNIKYSWREELEPFPKINDFCVMSLKKLGDNYKITYGVFKADSGDYKTLKLISEEMRYTPGILADVACIEWYVNSGGTEKDFSVEGDGKGNFTVTLKRTTGEIVQIYPKLEKTTFMATNASVPKGGRNSNIWLIFSFLAIVIITGSFIFIKVLKNKKLLNSK